MNRSLFKRRRGTTKLARGQPGDAERINRESEKRCPPRTREETSESSKRGGKNGITTLVTAMWPSFSFETFYRENILFLIAIATRLDRAWNPCQEPRGFDIIRQFEIPQGPCPRGFFFKPPLDYLLSFSSSSSSSRREQKERRRGRRIGLIFHE